MGHTATRDPALSHTYIQYTREDRELIWWSSQNTAGSIQIITVNVDFHSGFIHCISYIKDTSAFISSGNFPLVEALNPPVEL